MNVENFVDMMRPYCLFWASIASSKVLCNDDFSSIGGSEKGGYEATLGNKYCENCGQCG